jgi:hypothetical protein
MPGGVFSAPEHTAAPLPKIRRPQEDIDKSSERLNRSRKQPEMTDQHMLSPRTVKSAADIDVSVNRLYQQAMDRDKRRKEKEESLSATALSSTAKTVSEEEIAEGVNHLYFRAVEQHRASTAKSRSRYAFSPPRSPRVNVGEMSARVYNTALDKRKDIHDKLLVKYVDQTMPKYRKLSKAEVKASGERLCTLKAR